MRPSSARDLSAQTRPLPMKTSARTPMRRLQPGRSYLGAERLLVSGSLSDSSSHRSLLDGARSVGTGFAQPSGRDHRSCMPSAGLGGGPFVSNGQRFSQTLIVQAVSAVWILTGAGTSSVSAVVRQEQEAALGLDLHPAGRAVALDGAVAPVATPSGGSAKSQASGQSQRTTLPQQLQPRMHWAIRWREPGLASRRQARRCSSKKSPMLAGQQLRRGGSSP